MNENDGMSDKCSSEADDRPMPKHISEYGPSQVFSPLGPVGPVARHSDQIREAVNVLHTRYISLWQLGLMSAAMQLFLFCLAPACSHSSSAASMIQAMAT